MILLDFSSIAVSSIFSQAKGNSSELSEDFIRHLILNSIRSYNEKFRGKFGEMIIACDGGSWRKGVFEHYKASRKKTRDDSKIDWDEVYRIINTVKDEIHEFLPYKVIQCRGAEADDIIAILAGTTQEFGKFEDVMIVSSDLDFVSLQKWKNVQQFSHKTKKLVKESNPQKSLFEHIVRGCSGDGVPNILSPADSFVTGTRQKPVSQKKIDALFDVNSEAEFVALTDAATLERFKLNRQMIDFDFIPQEITDRILGVYDKYPQKDNSKVLNYLVSKRCRQLVSCASDFFRK